MNLSIYGFFAYTKYYLNENIKQNDFTQARNEKDSMKVYLKFYEKYIHTWIKYVGVTEKQTKQKQTQIFKVLYCSLKVISIT